MPRIVLKDKDRFESAEFQDRLLQVIRDAIREEIIARSDRDIPDSFFRSLQVSLDGRAVLVKALSDEEDKGTPEEEALINESVEAAFERLDDLINAAIAKTTGSEPIDIDSELNNYQ